MTRKEYSLAYAENEYNSGYVSGWREARDMVNWEMRALTDENSRLKIENKQFKTALHNVRRLLKW